MSGKTTSRFVAGCLAAIANAGWAATVGEQAGSYGHSLIQVPSSPPALAAAAIGSIVAAWPDAGEDGTWDIFVSTGWGAIRLPGTGDDPAQRAHVSVGGDQIAPAVAMDAVGNFVVAWQSEEPGPGGRRAIFARRFGSDGQPIGSEFQVDTASGAPTSPAVGMDAFGNFVIVWREAAPSGIARIVARRYLAGGQAVGSEFDVSAAGTATNPSVGMGAWGEFAVAWEQAIGPAQNVYVRSYATDGTPQESAAAVGPANARRQMPAVAMDAHGRFVIVWHETGEATSAIFARQYPDAVPHAGTFAVSQSEPDGSAPSVAIDASGDFVITWQSAGRAAWVARLFSQAGEAITGELPGSGTSPRVVMDADGDFYVASYVEGRVVVSQRVGLEKIDVAISVDAPDRVQADEWFYVAYRVSNNHPPSSETGIPAVDSAIGVAHGIRLWSYLPGVSVREGPSAACNVAPADEITCAHINLAAGTSLDAVTRLRAYPGTLSTSTDLYSDNEDADAANNHVERTIVLECAPGTGGTIEFSVQEFTVDEGGPSATVVMNRVGRACGELQVGYSVGGTASASDYRIYNGYLPPVVAWGHDDQSQRAIYVFGQVDWLDEINDQESVEIGLSLVSGAGNVDGRNAQVWIKDREGQPEVRAGSSPGALYEGQAGYFYAQLGWRSERPVTVPFTLGGSATSGEDYTVPEQATIVIEPGTLFTKLPVQTLSDGIDEGYHESITFTLGTPTNAYVDKIPAWSLTIYDSDPAPSVGIVTADASVLEGGGRYVVVGLSGPSGNTISVPLQIVTGGDDVQLSRQVLVFPPGLTQTNFFVAAIQDSVAEPDETAIVRLVSDGSVRLGDDVEFQLAIQDDDGPPIVNFAVAEQAIAESAGVAALTITLSHASAKPVEVTFRCDGPGSSATYETDYRYSIDRFTVPAGQTSVRATIDLVNDAIPEFDEDAVCLLGEVTNAEIGARPSHTLSILDDDPSAGIRDILRSAFGE